jgi:hypothetical protein
MNPSTANGPIFSIVELPLDVVFAAQFLKPLDGCPMNFKIRLMPFKERFQSVRTLIDVVRLQGILIKAGNRQRPVDIKTLFEKLNASVVLFGDADERKVFKTRGIQKISVRASKESASDK